MCKQVQSLWVMRFCCACSAQDLDSVPQRRASYRRLLAVPALCPAARPALLPSLRSLPPQRGVRPRSFWLSAPAHSDPRHRLMRQKGRVSSSKRPAVSATPVEYKEGDQLDVWDQGDKVRNTAAEHSDSAQSMVHTDTVHSARRNTRTQLHSARSHSARRTTQRRRSWPIVHR